MVPWPTAQTSFPPEDHPLRMSSPGPESLTKDSKSFRVSDGSAFTTTSPTSVSDVGFFPAEDDLDVAALPFSDGHQFDVSSVNLHKFIEKGDWKKLQRCISNLELNASDTEIQTVLTAANDNRETPLHVASWKAPTKTVLSLLELVPLDEREECLLALDKDGNTPLHLACANLDERVEFSVIKNILLLVPLALEVKNSNGDTRKSTRLWRFVVFEARRPQFFEQPQLCIFLYRARPSRSLTISL